MHLLLFVTAAILITQAPPAAGTQMCTVSGRVTNSLTGEPVTKAKLHLAPDTEGSSDGDSNRHGYVTSSGAGGAFQFTGIEPGSYTLSGDHLGFLRTEYGAKKGMHRGSILVVGPGQAVSQLSFALTPGAVLAGRVVDSDGDPVSQVGVSLLVQSWTSGKPQHEGRFQDVTDDRGDFRIFDVEAGKYILTAQRHQPFMRGTQSDGKAQISFVQTFYPGTTNAESATPIHLKAGQQITDIELRLLSAQTFHVRGKVAAAPADRGFHGMLVSLRSGERDWWRGQRFQPLDKDGLFDISGVPPGSYRLLLISPSKHGGQNLNFQPVTVAGQDVNDIVLSIVPGARVRGQVRVSGTPASGAKPWNPALFQVTLTPSELYGGSDGIQSTPAKADGSFTLENVTPWDYSLQTSGGPEGAYLVSVRLNGEEFLGKPVDLSHAQSGDLQLVFRYGTAQLSTKVELPAGVPQPGGGEMRPPAPTLVLIPDLHQGSDPDYQQRVADTSGNATFSGIVPGSYRVYAFTDAPPSELQNPALLKAIESKGAYVELKEGDRKQLQLTVISSDEMQQILSKLAGNAE